MEGSELLKERAQNLWASFTRKVDPIAQATQFEPIPEFDLGVIGGL